MFASLKSIFIQGYMNGQWWMQYWTGKTNVSPSMASKIMDQEDRYPEWVE